MLVIKLNYRLLKLILLAVVVISVSMLGYVMFKEQYGHTVRADDEIAVPIIMYHHILKSNNGTYVVSPKTLENDFKYITEKGFNPVFVKDLVGYVYNDVPLPENPIVITFDDGYENNYFYGMPLFDKYNIKVSISIIGFQSDLYSQDDKSHIEYSHLKWSQIKEMHESNLVEICNHSYNLHDKKKRKGINKKSEETVGEYREMLIEDLNLLQEKVYAATGALPQTFAYPFGYSLKSSYDILKEAGFKATLSSAEGMNYITKDPECLYKLKRFNRPSKYTTEQFFKKIGLE